MGNWRKVAIAAIIGMERGFVNVTVQAYSGYKANERPCRFRLDNRSYEVLEVLDGHPRAVASVLAQRPPE